MPKFTDDISQLDLWGVEEAGNIEIYEPPESYQEEVEKLISTHGDERLMENTLGLVGEAGEVAEKVKKYIRDGTMPTQEDMVKELGDVLFYVAALSTYWGVSLSEVAERNLAKLYSRKARGVLGGSGDNR
jgi:NTP pyrophosphatase (non-canonical NTP hydrolase)